MVMGQYFFDGVGFSLVCRVCLFSLVCRFSLATVNLNKNCLVIAGSLTKAFVIFV